jgi:hypothetical protein
MIFWNPLKTCPGVVNTSWNDFLGVIVLHLSEYFDTYDLNIEVHQVATKGYCDNILFYIEQ